MSLDLESRSEATSGAIGSLLSSTILYPLDTCKTKYQARFAPMAPKNAGTLFSIKDADIWKIERVTLTEGTWSEAFDGLGISLLLTLNPAIQYTVFDQLKQRLLKGKQNGKGQAPETFSFQRFRIRRCFKDCCYLFDIPGHQV